MVVQRVSDVILRFTIRYPGVKVFHLNFFVFFSFYSSAGEFFKNLLWWLKLFFPFKTFHFPPLDIKWCAPYHKHLLPLHLLQLKNQDWKHVAKFCYLCSTYWNLTRATVKVLAFARYLISRKGQFCKKKSLAKIDNDNTLK